MRLTVVGTGYVGLVSGACFSEFGHQVTCVDANASVIERLRRNEIPIFEPGLDDLVARNVRAGRLNFTIDLAAAVQGADAVFIAVGTPSRRGDGHADLSFVYEAVREVAGAAGESCLIINKSTVPVGTAREVERIARAAAPDKQISVASNPEFLREGSAIADFTNPDRVICGVNDARSRTLLEAIYRPLSLREVRILFTSREAAEVIKYAANAFLAVKVSYINEIADLCERVGADVQVVAKGIGLDKRIGDKFLHPGPGYGGSCFPKDTLALLRTGEQVGVPLEIVSAAVHVNNTRKRAMATRIVDACGGVAGKTLGVLGVTFKANTDDMRDAPSLTIIPALQTAGARIRAYDPAGQPHAETLLPDVEWSDDPYTAMEGCDALVVLTEWFEFRALDFDRVKAALVEPVFVDLRNIYRPAEMRALGFHYHSVGRPEDLPPA
jgi:UDPglucose 6-dehydrogenase